MIKLASGDRLYMYSSVDIQSVITGATVFSGVKTNKTLFNYRILAGMTKLVYESQYVTEINDIAVSGAASNATIKVFINGTSASDNQVYQGVVSPGYNIIHDSSGWTDNTFVKPTVGGTDFSKGINIASPTSSENITLFFTGESIKIREVYDVIRGSGASVDWNIAFGADRTTADGTVFAVDRNTVSTAGASTDVFDVSDIPANNWVWLTTSAVSGTIEDLNITIRYT